MKNISYMLIVAVYALMALTVSGHIQFIPQKILGVPGIFFWFYALALTIVLAMFLLYQSVLKPWAEKVDRS